MTVSDHLLSRLSEWGAESLGLMGIRLDHPDQVADALDRAYLPRRSRR